MTTGNIQANYSTGHMERITQAILPDGDTVWANYATTDVGTYKNLVWSGANSIPTGPIKHPYSHTYYIYEERKIKHPFYRAEKPYLYLHRVRRTFRYGGEKKLDKKDNPYSCVKTVQYNPRIENEITHPNGYPYKVRNTSVAALYATSSWGYGPIPPTWTANDEINLINKLTEKITGTDFNPSLFFAEAGRAVDMISENVRRIAAALLHLRRGTLYGPTSLNPVRAREGERRLLRESAGFLLGHRDPGHILEGVKLNKNGLARGLPPSTVKAETLISKRWLELQYGWLPLLSDIKSGAEFVALQSEHRPKVATFKAGKKINRNEPGKANVSVGFSEAYVFTARRIIARITEGSLPSSLMASGALNPEIVAWELVPYSFVYDWFHPFGSYLEARASVQKLTGTFILTTYNRAYYTNPYMKMGSGKLPPLYYYSKVAVSRNVQTTLAVPFPNVKSFKEAFKWKRLANAVALLGVAVARPDNSRRLYRL